MKTCLRSDSRNRNSHVFQHRIILLLSVLIWLMRHGKTSTMMYTCRAQFIQITEKPGSAIYFSKHKPNSNYTSPIISRRRQLVIDIHEAKSGEASDQRMSFKVARIECW